jgi:hypothetical protein
LDDAPIVYSASMSRLTDSSAYRYDFIISPTENMVYNMAAFKSTLTLTPSTRFTVSVVNKKFIPSAYLFGKLDYNGGTAKLKQLSFENVHLVSAAPYITSGYFALTSGAPADSNAVARLPLSINSIGLGFSNSNMVLSVGISLVLGDPGANSFSATTVLNIHSKIVPRSDGRMKITFDRIDVQDILLSIHTTPFILDGVLSIRKNDPTYGELFYGSVSFTIVPIMDDKRALVSIGFGKKDGMKYWFVDMGIPMKIPLAPGLEITAMYGGVSNRVRSTFTTPVLLQRAFNAPPAQAHGANNLIPFVPDPSRGLSFFAGVALQGQSKEDVFNAEVLLAVTFNANGGLNTIELAGNAFLMVKRSERGDENRSKIYGNMLLAYDHPNKTFDAEINVQVFVPSTLTGNAQIKMHIDPTDWYFWINRPSNRAHLTLVGLFNTDLYFMIGTKTDPIPPPPAYVTNVVSASSVIADLGPVSTGDGFAVGASFSAGFDKEVSITDKWKGYAAAGFGGGFDVSMLRMSQNAHCEGQSGPVGANRWYCQGQAYAYLNGGFGAKHRKVDGTWESYSIGSVAAAVLLQARLPKPSYFYGTIGLNVELLQVISFSFDVDVEFGNDCTIVN